MVKKGNIIFRPLIIIAVIFAATLIAFLVSAAVNPNNSKVIAPTSGTNYSAVLSSNTSLVFNYTFLNVSAGASDVNGTFNASVYYNRSATAWDLVANLTECFIFAGTATNISCTGTVNPIRWANNSMIKEGYYGINITVINSTNGTLTKTGIGQIGNISTIMIDNTEPSFAAFNLPAIVNASYTNHSSTNAGGNITMNITAIDALANVSVVMFNMINSSGGVNDSILGIAEGLAGRYSVSLDTLSFPDGLYNITIFVNDTAGNFNATLNDSTAEISNIRIDNTAPTGTFSCTNEVEEGDTVTCSCSPSDSGSGINSALTSFTANPSSASTGTFEVSCTFGDHAGKTGSASDTYTVTGSGGGSSSGGGGGSSSSSTWTTYSVTDDAFDTGYTRDLGENQRLKVQVETVSKTTEDHFVGVVDVSASTAIIEVTSTPQRVVMNIGETKMFEVTGDNFYDLSVTLDSIVNNKAKVRIVSVYEEIPATQQQAAAETQDEVATAPPVTESSGIGAAWMIVLMILLAVIVAVVIWVTMKKKK